MEVQQDPIVEGANVDRMLTDAIFHSHDTRSDRNGSIDQGFLICTYLKSTWKHRLESSLPTFREVLQKKSDQTATPSPDTVKYCVI